MDRWKGHTQAFGHGNCPERRNSLVVCLEERAAVPLLSHLAKGPGCARRRRLLEDRQGRADRTRPGRMPMPQKVNDQKPGMSCCGRRSSRTILLVWRILAWSSSCPNPRKTFLGPATATPSSTRRAGHTAPRARVLALPVARRSASSASQREPRPKRARGPHKNQSRQATGAPPLRSRR